MKTRDRERGFLVIKSSILVAFIAACMSAQGVDEVHQFSMPISDASQAGAPVKYSGTVTVGKEMQITKGRHYYSEYDDIEALNSSDKSVLLMVAKLRISGVMQDDINTTYQNEYFFSPSLLEPNAVQKLEGTTAPFGKLSGAVRLQPL